MKLPRDPESWGAFTGIPGAFFLAVGSNYGHYGWLLFLVSNICWIVFAIRGKFNKLLLQQFAFLATTLLGLWNTLIAPWLSAG